MKKEDLIKELEWWRNYGKYVKQVYNNINKKASEYADGDDSRWLEFIYSERNNKK